MNIYKYIALLSLIFLFSSCFHAKVTTDKRPSAQVIEQPWAHGFIFGLVGPSSVNASKECSNGVAKVETKLSFLNQLVSALTFNLYTPMHIKVTCAAGTGMSSLDVEANEKLTLNKRSSDKEIAKTIQEAADRSNELQQPVYVQFK